MRITTITREGFRARLFSATPGNRRLGRDMLAGLTAILLLGLTASHAAAASPGYAVRPTQQLAVLLTPHDAHLAPAGSSPRVAFVPAHRPITGEQTTLPVIGHSTGSSGIRWLRVMLPGRPDGLSGWIALQGTRELLTPWRIVVDLATRSVSVYRSGRLGRRFRAVVGKPSTPTPTGHFFVEETVQMSAGEAGGPFALALSARSNALQEFEGGPGQIALHGREKLGGTLGAAESHGCVRLSTADISWLAARIGPGTPTSILRG
jgi:hypothetical protein